MHIYRLYIKTYTEFQDDVSFCETKYKMINNIILNYLF